MTSSGLREWVFFTLFLHQDRTVSYAIRCLLFNDLTDSRKKSSEISVGWIWLEIVGTADIWPELDFEARCEGTCLLNDSSSLSQLPRTSKCKSSFSWSFKESNEWRILVPSLFLNASNASEIASASGSNKALFFSTTACTSGSLNFDAYVCSLPTRVSSLCHG